MSTIRLGILTSFVLVPALAFAQPAPVPPTGDPATAPRTGPEPCAPARPCAPAPPPPPPVEPPPPPPPPSEASGDDKKAKPAKLVVTPGGYLQVDSRSFPDDSGTHTFTIRRLRLKVDGTAYQYVVFHAMVEFAGPLFVIEDAWAELSLAPELAIRFGKDKAQFGLELIQSAANLLFVERSYPTQLSPDRVLGVAARGDVANGLVHYSAALVDAAADNTVLPSLTDHHYEGEMHLLLSPFRGTGYGDLAIGGAVTFGQTLGSLASTGLTPIVSDGQAIIVQFAVGPVADLAQTAYTDGFRKRFTAHGYYYGGPVGVLTEYVRDDEPVAILGTRTLMTNQAWQLAASLAITPGDEPSYYGLKPKHVFDPVNGTWGAFEVAARYGELRIDPKAFATGIVNAATSVRRARDYTFGVNWYLSEYAKLQINYSMTQYAGGAPTGNRQTENLIAIRAEVSL